MNARYYSTLNRALSADTIVPDPSNPQSFNRYSYALNNPINLVDPSGHDPLDDQWHDSFREAHGRDPGWEDRFLRLFSIAFPGEWDWNAFYDGSGYIKYDAFESTLSRPPSSRSWANMPDALARLSTYYASNESEQFSRDIGTLFAGLPDRFSASMNEAVTGCVAGFQCENTAMLPAHAWAYLQPSGMPLGLRGGDRDANVHHWAWGVTLGHYQRALAVGINTGREIQKAGGIRNATSNIDSRADIKIGNRGAFFGSALNSFGPRATRFLYWYHVAEWGL